MLKEARAKRAPHAWWPGGADAPCIPLAHISIYDYCSRIHVVCARYAPSCFLDEIEKRVIVFSESEAALNSPGPPRRASSRLLHPLPHGRTGAGRSRYSVTRTDRLDCRCVDAGSLGALGPPQLVGECRLSVCHVSAVTAGRGRLNMTVTVYRESELRCAAGRRPRINDKAKNISYSISYRLVVGAVSVQL